MPIVQLGQGADRRSRGRGRGRGLHCWGSSVAASIVAKQEFAGYWEYVLDEGAIFTAPAHPFWGGTAMIGSSGELLGIGSLKLEQGQNRPEQHDEPAEDHLNMIVPIDLLKPIFEDLLHHGRPNRPPRPWLGCYAAEIDDRIVLIGLADRGPAQRAGLRTGDVVRAIGGEEVHSLADMFRRVWAVGPAGAEIPIRLVREGRTVEHKVASADRTSFFKAPRRSIEARCANRATTRVAPTAAML